MLKVKFPAFKAQRYYKIHFQYLLDIFKHTQCDISFYDREDDQLIVFINGKEIEFNYWDDISKYSENNILTFKFHCEGRNSKAIPFTPVSFYDWAGYTTLESAIRYKAVGRISYRQRAYGNAVERRKKVLELLKQRCVNLSYVLLPQLDYWKDIGNCSVAVFVPGYSNNILDRAQLQYMFLGCATISPHLPEQLPFNRNIWPGGHYIQCKDDYSDLIEKIEWCKDNKEKCKEIGKNAKELTQFTSTPHNLVNWIKANI